MTRLFHPESSINLDEFKTICSRTTDPTVYPLASTIQKNIPIYDASTLDPLSPTQTTSLQDEWYHILSTGPGIFVLKAMYQQPTHAQTLESANAAFNRIIHTERQSTTTKKGDHFAASGKNDRIWNSFTKHAVTDPASFIAYYSNPWLRLVSESWLGPAYRVTAQVNIVKPGGAAQDPHRDYHLGFQEEARCAAFPVSIHRASQSLTLQGAVAHSDMPPASGPTRFLPFSQCYDAGYLAWRREEFQAYFQRHYVALPLELGDGVFFNPAVFHAAGANEMVSAADGNGGFHRKANLLQIGCALGKTMEDVDAVPIVARCWGGMLERYRAAGGVVDSGLDALVRAIGDGYPFPTNLDRRPPAPNGMAPESEQDVLLRGLREEWTVERVVGELKRLARDSQDSGGDLWSSV
ncbi:phytanoyl-CoA dioxygenase family protein [Aspergillus egyptiacus]|nr:phytanoyl-CoA dioxygenase family protein [Aspergillus egyptiacus]